MGGEGMHHAWVRLFWTCVVGWIPWALATPIVEFLGRRFPPVKLRPLSMWLPHLLAFPTIGLVFCVWTSWLQILFNPYAIPSGPGSFRHLLFDKYYGGILSSVVLYGTILAVSYALDSRARLAFQQTETARLNELLSKAQLDALRRQIEPQSLARFELISLARFDQH